MPMWGHIKRKPHLTSHIPAHIQDRPPSNLFSARTIQHYMGYFQLPRGESISVVEKNACQRGHTSLVTWGDEDEFFPPLYYGDDKIDILECFYANYPPRERLA